MIPSLLCEQCGALNPATARFCNYCGQSVSAPAATTSAPPLLSLPPSPPPSTLTGLFHGVIAIEWINWPTLTPEQQQACHAISHQKGLVFGASLDRQTGRHQFLRITHAPDAPTCADTALQLALAIRRSVMQQPDLSCAIGIDMEPAEERNPLCAIPQRANAGPNVIVAGHRVMDSVLTHYPSRPVEAGSEIDDPAFMPPSSTELPAAQAFTEVEDPTFNHDDSEAAAQGEDNHPQAPPDERHQPAEPSADVIQQPTADTPAVWPASNSDAAEATPLDGVEDHLGDDNAQSASDEPSAANLPANGMDLDALAHQAIPMFWTHADKEPAATGSARQVAEQLTALISNHLQLNQPGNEGAGQLVVLCGHEGAGKTHLVQSLLQRLMAQRTSDEDVPCFWLHGQSGPPFAPLSLWSSVLSRFYQIDALGIPLSQIQSVFEGQAFPHEEFNRQWQAMLASWFGCMPLQALDAGYTIQPRLLAGMLAAFFQLVAQHRPVILLLDDLEEADPASLEILIDLLNMGLCVELPVLMIATHNQDMAPAGLLADALKPGRHLTLPLYHGDELTTFLQEGPLNAVWGQFPSHLLDQVTQFSHGNPLIIEECLRLLFLKGALHPLNGPTLTLTETDPMAVFMERLALLPEDAQHAAQWFALIGHPVTPGVFAELSGLADPMEAINLLKDHGILMEEASTALSFRHRLLQQWVYQSLAENDRQQGHARLAEVLDRFNEAQRGAPFALLAEQAELAGDIELAAHAWSASGVWAAQLHSLTGFNMAMIRSAQLFQSLPATPQLTDSVSLVTRYLAQLNAHNQPQVTQAVLEQPAPTAAQVPDRLQQLLTHVTSLEAMGQFAEGMPVLENALHTLADLPDTTQEQLYLNVQQVKWQTALGLLSDAEATLADQVMPKLADPSGHALHRLSWLDTYSAKVTLQLLACRPDVFDTLDLMMSHPYLAEPTAGWQRLMAMVFRHQGHYARAQETLNSVQPTDPGDVQDWHIEQATLHNQTGQFEKALGTCQLALSQSPTSQWQRTQLLTCQAEALLGVQKWESASKAIKQVIATAMDGHYRLQLLDAKLLWSDAQLATQQWDSAAQYLQTLWDQAGVPMAHRYRIAARLARAWVQQGNPIEAGKLLEPLWQTVTDSRQLPLVAELAEAVGRFYLGLARQSETPKAQTHNGIQFIQRAERLWRQMQNPYQSQRLAHLLNRANVKPL